MIKGLDYGMGTDMWNVSKAKHKHFTKVCGQIPGILMTSTTLNLINSHSFFTISKSLLASECFSQKLQLSFYINASSFLTAPAGPASGGPSG